jgi:hypothetical protein
VKRILCQSFDYPGDVLLPGMKLGINHSSGHIWSLSSWLTEKSPDGLELKIRRRGVVCCSSRVFRDGNFEFIKQKRYNFSIVSNKNEVYFTDTAVDQSAILELLLTTVGRLYDFDGSLTLQKQIIVMAIIPMENARFGTSQLTVCALVIYLGKKRVTSIQRFLPALI